MEEGLSYDSRRSTEKKEEERKEPHSPFRLSVHDKKKDAKWGIAIYIWESIYIHNGRRKKTGARCLYKKQ